MYFYYWDESVPDPHRYIQQKYFRVGIDNFLKYLL